MTYANKSIKVNLRRRFSLRRYSLRIEIALIFISASSVSRRPEYRPLDKVRSSIIYNKVVWEDFVEKKVKQF